MNLTTEEIFLERRGGGAPHKLIQYRNNEYIFSTAEEWMPIRIIGNKDDIRAIDSDGGPFIGVGSEVNGRIVKKIYKKDGVGLMVCF